MADDVILNSGSGGDTIAADEIGGVKHQRVKVQYGADGSATDASETNPLPVAEQGSSVDSGNSSTATLGISGVFTGTGVDVTSYGSISVFVFSDEASATDGLSMQFSSDNSNWDIQDDHSIAANVGEGFVLPRVAQFFRIVYTNGGTAQTAFRLETILNRWPVTGEVEELNIDLDDSDLAQTTRSVLAAFNGTNYQNINATSGGNLKVSVEESAIDATDGAAHGASQLGYRAMGTDGTNDQQISTNATGHVNIADGGNTITVDGTVTASNAAGDVAHDTADSGNPVKVGAVAETTEQAAVGDGDRVNLMADAHGKLVTSPFAVGARYTDGTTAAITGTANTQVIAAPGVGLKLHVTSVIVTNSHATVGTVVELKSGSTTVKLRQNAKADGGGFALTFPTPIKLAANEALNAANLTTGSNTYVTATAYIAP